MCVQSGKSKRRGRTVKVKRVHSWPTWSAVDEAMSIHISAALCQNTPTVLLQLMAQQERKGETEIDRYRERQRHKRDRGG